VGKDGSVGRSPKNDVDKGNMAVMLENQARQLVTENSKTGTASNAEQWSGVALPLGP
jgi:hypothetical protein